MGDWHPGLQSWEMEEVTDPFIPWALPSRVQIFCWLFQQTGTQTITASQCPVTPAINWAGSPVYLMELFWGLNDSLFELFGAGSVHLISVSHRSLLRPGALASTLMEHELGFRHLWSKESWSRPADILSQGLNGSLWEKSLGVILQQSLSPTLLPPASLHPQRDKSRFLCSTLWHIIPSVAPSCTRC